MNEPRPIEPGAWPGFEDTTVPGASGPLSLRVAGAPDASQAVLFCHSILTSSAIWHRQARLLAGRGYRVVCMDLPGHGSSPAGRPVRCMDDLVADVVAVLDAMRIQRAHYVGVSLGGMIGFGLGLDHAERVASLTLCAARADAPPPFAAAWDERIATVRAEGMPALAMPTVERWFGPAFVAAHPGLAGELASCIERTTLDGFVGCARALQSLDYLDRIGAIVSPTTLLIGSRDHGLIEPMRDIAPLIPGATFAVIDDAGHLPQLERPAEVDQALLAHLTRAVQAGD